MESLDIKCGYVTVTSKAFIRTCILWMSKPRSTRPVLWFLQINALRSRTLPEVSALDSLVYGLATSSQTFYPYSVLDLREQERNLHQKDLVWKDFKAVVFTDQISINSDYINSFDTLQKFWGSSQCRSLQVNFPWWPVQFCSHTIACSRSKIIRQIFWELWEFFVRSAGFFAGSITCSQVTQNVQR